MDKKIRIHMFVSGIVQGVFFRNEMKNMACNLGIFGWACNLEDGRVEAVFEGDSANVEKLLQWVKKGPDLAKVSGVRVKKEKYIGEFFNFLIL